MALPKLETKTYTLTLPSTGEDIKYRPFLVKEQKVLLMAQDSKNDSEVVDAMSQLINDCTFGKVDPKICPMFDAEYIFLKLRAKSIGEKVEAQVVCPDDEKTKVNVSVNLDEIECTMVDNHTNKIDITDTVSIVFNYPLLNSFKNVTKDNQTEAMFDVIIECIKEINFEDTTYRKEDTSKQEMVDFLESLSTEQFTKVTTFFDTMPKVRHAVEVTNPETKVKSEVILQGLQSFLV